MANVEFEDEQSKRFQAALAAGRSKIVSLPETRALRADAAEMRRFVDLAFRHCAGIKGWVALRAFEHEGKSGRPADSAWCPWGPEVFEWAPNMASETAARTGASRAVFSPPVALFGDKLNASEARAASAANVVAGPVIAVELDHRPAESRARLEAVLGPATIVVESGGVWKADDGSEEKKLHLYWRLARPAVDGDALVALTRARRIACDLVGADPTGVSIATRCAGLGPGTPKANRACAGSSAAMKGATSI